MSSVQPRLKSLTQSPDDKENPPNPSPAANKLQLQQNRSSSIKKTVLGSVCEVYVVEQEEQKQEQFDDELMRRKRQMQRERGNKNGVNFILKVIEC